MLTFFQIVNFIGNFIIFHYILGKLYFNYADNIGSFIGLVLVFVLALTTTILTFHFAKKVYIEQHTMGGNH
ncbi:hypothetical protein [Thalassobacillus hwangdonensis]|uniref:Uncharacterized protein n=1 Tax=Thalassobacillus hwangdonensis TaxID=546108 RepID=A0ABW3L3C8_9BACI